MELKFDAVHITLATHISTVLDCVGGYFSLPIDCDKQIKQNAKQAFDFIWSVQVTYLHWYCCLFTVYWLDPQPWLEGSNKLGFILLSFCPSFQQFCWNWLSIFWNFTWCYSLTWGCAWQPDFLKKESYFFPPKMGKIGQKWTKDRVFWMHWKI